MLAVPLQHGRGGQERQHSAGRRNQSPLVLAAMFALPLQHGRGGQERQHSAGRRIQSPLVLAAMFAVPFRMAAAARSASIRLAAEIKALSDRHPIFCSRGRHVCWHYRRGRGQSAFI
jgi:hypothetical protein